MKITVDQIQSRIAAQVDQDENTANITSTDYSLRLSYINRSLLKWAEINDWQVLYKEFNSLISTSTANASVAMPSDYRKLASFPKITYDGTTTKEFPEVLPQEDGQYQDTDRRVWILGSPQSGYVLRILGVTLASGASVKIPYYASPQSLASPANIAEVPNPDYLVQQSIAFLWEAQEDARFPQAKVDADRLLSNMIETENTFNFASQYNRVKTTDETRFHFRMGRD